MGHLLREHRARRGKLPTLDPMQALNSANEAWFPCGLMAGGGRLYWKPGDAVAQDHPHCLLAGTSGAGKTRKIEEWALTALEWNWRVTIIDFKGGAGFFAALSQGAELVHEPIAAVKAIEQASREIDQRNRLMMDTPIIRARKSDGVLVEDRAVNFFDPAFRALYPDMRPWLILIDELASISGLEIPGKRGRKATKSSPAVAATPGISGKAALSRLVQLARSAGVHAVLGIQRPDAELIPGFVKANVASRILLGHADKEAEEMVLGSAITDHPDRALPRPTGTGFALNIGGRSIVRFHASLYDRERSLPFAKAPGSDQDSADAGPVGPPSAHAPEAPVPSSVPAQEPPSGSSVGPVAGVRLPEGEAPPASLPPSSPSSVSWFGRVVRPVATGPFVRTYLRLRAVRYLTGPVVSGPFERNPFLALACKDEAGYRCRACGAGAPVEADHVRPLSFGGADAPENLQALCIRPHRTGCHGAKSDGEDVVRKLRARGRARGLGTGVASGLLTALRLLPPVAWLAITPFLVGLISRWWDPLPVPSWMLAAGWLALATFGWAFFREFCRKFAVGRVFFKQRQPGLDGRSSWDDERERDRGGLLGPLARQSGRNREWMLTFRYGTAILCALFLAGYTLPWWPAVALGAAGLVL